MIFIYCDSITASADFLTCMNGADWRQRGTGRRYCRYHIRREVGRNWRQECDRVPAPSAIQAKGGWGVSQRKPSRGEAFAYAFFDKHGEAWGLEDLSAAHDEAVRPWREALDAMTQIAEDEYCGATHCLRCDAKNPGHDETCDIAQARALLDGGPDGR